MSDDTLVRVEGVSKKFCRSLKRSLWYGIKDTAGDLAGRRESIAELRPEEFWAVDDVSFELKRGECLGLIGRNGAGKTTLLKMLNGLIKPDKGRIEMRGRVGALIALGAGFNPILTGRENVYVNGSVLGLTKREIDAKFDEIVDFAEIGEFIDSPVQSYSSGMQVRLGFAVATAMNPEVLILDEVLAVGDIAFRVKCGNRIREIMSEAAVILVSHSMEFISWYATQAMVLSSGKVAHSSPSVVEGIKHYEALNRKSTRYFGRGGVDIEKVQFRRPAGAHEEVLESFKPHERLAISAKFNVADNIVGARLGVRIIDTAGQSLVSYQIPNPDHSSEAVFSSGTHSVCLDLGAIELTGGQYDLMMEFHDERREMVLTRAEGVLSFFVDSGLITYTKVLKQALLLQHDVA